MKKLITLFIAGVFGLSLFAASLPVYAKNDKANNGKSKNAQTTTTTTTNKGQTQKLLKPVKLQNLVAFVTAVDLTNKTVNVRKSIAKRVIKADQAKVLIITDNGVETKTLADLKVGVKARFVVKKAKTAKWTYEAVSITQNQSSKKSMGLGALPKEERDDEDEDGDGDEGKLNVQFTSANGSGLESVTPVSVPVKLSKVSNKDVKVDYTVTGTATGGGVDYTLANGELTILKGQTTASLSLSVVADTLDELDETVVVTLSNPENAVLGTNKVYTYTIKDGNQPTVGFSSASGNGLESVTPVSIPVALSKVSTHEVKVKYAVTGTATGGGVDYTLANGELTFAAGDTTKNLSLAVVDDTLDELNETVIVTLSNPTNAALGATTVYTYTINDNDQPTVGFSSASGNGLESATPVSIPVTLSKVSTHDVKVKYAVTGTATGGGVDYTLANGELTIATGATSANLSLAVVDDTAQDPNETVILTLSEPTGATLGATTVYTYTITDND